MLMISDGGAGSLASPEGNGEAMKTIVRAVRINRCKFSLRDVSRNALTVCAMCGAHASCEDGRWRILWRTDLGRP
jgi:hypothetical protein